MSKSKKFKTKLVRMSLMAIAATGLTITALTLGLGVFSNSVFAEPSANGSNPATSRFAVTLKEIIALRILDKTASSEISNLTLDITPTPNGVFTKGSFIAETSTSNATGYKLYLTSTGKDHLDTYTNSLINIDSSVEPSVGTIPSLASGASVTEAAFRVNNSAYKNKWGYSTNGLIVNATTNNGATTINSIADNTNTSEITYADIPENTESRQIDNKSAAIDKGITPITIGVNASSAVTSGVYKNTLELTAIANPLSVDYSLSFDGNSTGTVTGVPSTLEGSSVASSYTFTIPSNVPTTSGYTFKEWNTEADGSGDSYAPGDDFTVSADDIAGTDQVLYAIWEEISFWDITYMQEMTPEICANTTTPAKTATQTDTDGSHAGSSAYVPQRTLYDWRGADGTGTINSKVAPSSANAKGYVIRKLADGNCWMTQNLEIPLSTTAGVEVVSNSSGNLAPATPNSTTQQGSITSAGIWTPTGPGGTGNGTTPMNGNTKAANNTYYYSWYAATAGSGLSSDVNTDAPFSICPKGWRLPYNYTIDSSATSKSYSNMTKAYLNITTNTSTSTGYQTLEAFPLNFARSGYVSSGAFSTDGYGRYWSSTASSSATHAYALGYLTTSVYPQNYGNKYHGFIVRCVAL